jgi:peptidoglycan/LPS O-acetylase OafA/YrhL
MEWQLGWQWLKDNPQSWPLLVVCKVARLCVWLPDLDPAPKWLRATLYLPFLLLFIPGMLACLWRRDCWTPPWLAVHGTLLATVLTAIVFWGSPRFRDANAPLLMLYAAIGAGLFAPRARASGGSHLPLAARGP